MITPVARRPIDLFCWVCKTDVAERWVFDDLCLPCAIKVLERALKPDPWELLSLGRDPEDAP